MKITTWYKKTPNHIAKNGKKETNGSNRANF
jgi:hypothetical protein